ncbi:uncharacterized protein LOC129749825 [Uranotaenia lowii]|uniref:uncharacterized protein LOC129749825 n=1 Tax=Uranotaenia lowii TaxID=190385 RepID=UPI00247A2C4A|nr:uncharacterized protein LOC129749825 [Uranotaenia lowii]XP_055600891.1 uncharacterized protein LOC129749825 [Uranotaenia lowii]
MNQTTYTIWDPSQPNTKMKIINISNQGATQIVQPLTSDLENPTAAGMASSPPPNASADHIILQTHDGQEYLVNENQIGPIDTIPPENLIYMAAEDGSLIQGEVVHVQTTGDIIDHHQQPVLQGELLQPQDQNQDFMECEVTEEIITDDWVQTDGQECVQVTVDQLGATTVIGGGEDELLVPLPTDQDEYTTSRPYPCDFCSRRFRKKANLMNHLIAHSNDRQHTCNLCGARYLRRCDLLNHLKLHAYADDQDDLLRSGPEDEYDYELPSHITTSNNSHPLSDEEEEPDLFIPVAHKPSMQKPIKKPKVAKVVNTNTRYTKKSSSNTTNRSRQTAIQKPAESKFNPSVEPFVNLPPRFPVTDERKPFVCQKCGISFAREKALASHYRIHGGDCSFECETCGERFWDRSLLQDHIRQRHAANLLAAAPPSHENDEGSFAEMNTDQHREESEPAFYCDSCGLLCARQDLLKRHIKQVHGIGDEPISQIVRQRQQHQQQLNDENEEVCEEDEEDENEDDEQDPDKSLTPSKPLSCNVCGEQFAEPLDLLAHAEIHARGDAFQCQLCDESFGEEKSIKQHIQKDHSDELTENSCVICGKLCKTHTALLKHTWDHSRDRGSSYGSHCCSKCGKGFTNKARLKRHMVSHRNKSVRCEVCAEEFPDGRSLMNHRHSHTKTRQFPCHECGKTFGSRSSQQIHLRIHSGERPYGCRFCWKAFADGGTLRKHERVHTGEKPYGCSVCPRAFNQRVVLREHIRSHHSAPDPRKGSAMQPYFCTVCSQMFETSSELIQHLIQHSDNNTAMKRQPPTYPRKYKRRRKLSPEEIDKMENGKRGNKKKSTGFSAAALKVEQDEDLLKNPAEILLEYSSGSSNKKLIASPHYINSYDLLASTSSERSKTATIDDNGINLLSNVVLINSPSTSGEKKYKTIKTESLQGHSGNAIKTEQSYQSSGSRPRMIHTQKTKIATTDGKRKTKTVITKDTKRLSEPSTSYVPLQFKQSKAIATYREIPSDKISSESFPLLADGQEEDFVDDHSESSDQEALDALSSSVNRRNQQQVPGYEDLVNQNLLMEISRKDKYMDKYNKDIVNDLEEILRSPIKSSHQTVPPAVIMATPKVSHHLDPDGTEIDRFTAAPLDGESIRKTHKQPRKQQLKTIKKEDAQLSLTSALRNQRLTRGQLEREINFLREAYTVEPTSAPIIIKQEKDSPEKISAMLLNDFSSDANSSNAAPKMEPVSLDPVPVGQDPLASSSPQPEHESESILYQCEMCSAVFDDRSQLLLHVPIHI